MEVLALLVFDVLLNHLVRDVAAADGAVPSGPEVSSPELFPDVWQFFVEEVHTLALEFLRYVTDREIGWIGEEQVNMIRGNLSADDAHLQFGTDPPEQGSDHLTNLAHQDSSTVFWNPDQMHLQICFCVAVRTVELHAVIL